MAMTTAVTRTRRDKRVRKESVEFRIIFAATFAVFLIAGIIERLLPWNWLTRRQASVVQQAWESAGTCTTYAFMG
jgi:hypothetical protein